MAVGTPGCSAGSSRGAGQWDGAPAHLLSLHSSINKPHPHLPFPSWVCPKPAKIPSAGSIQGTAGSVSYRHCLTKGSCSMGGSMDLERSWSCSLYSCSKGKLLLPENISQEVVSVFVWTSPTQKASLPPHPLLQALSKASQEHCGDE